MRWISPEQEGEMDSVNTNAHNQPLRNSTQLKTVLLLIFAGLLYFFAFWPINAQGAQDRYMLSVFSPDEFAQYPYILQMMDQPADSFLGSVYRFVQYKHYYYGYPFYLYSALFSILPLNLLGLGSTSLHLLLLRQMVSVLPMLVSVGLLVYMQTRFKNTVRSVLLFLFLLTIPMVVINNLWWHPESLVLLFVVLTLFFMQRDDFSFKHNFYFAAIACGLAVATKLIGLFFFAAVPLYIFMGWYQGHINPLKPVQLAVKFVLLMMVVFFLSNPFLVFKSERDAALKAQMSQSEATVSGFVFAAESGPAGWVPVIQEYYSQLTFLGLACFAVLVGILNKQKRLTNSLILFWCLPFGLYLLFVVTLRHRYYFMPVLLPLFSTIPNILDGLFSQALYVSRFRLLKWAGFLIFIVIVTGQLFYNLNDVRTLYFDSLQKESKSEALQFFSVVEQDYLSHISLDRQLIIYRSVRVYVADEPRWSVKSRWGLTNYSYIERIHPDVIMLWKQELYDYTNLDALDSAVNPNALAKALPFYQDALSGSLQGYTMLYQNDFGVFFLSNDLAKVFFP